ncbi:Palmitoyltransferase [Mortierella claussenii]|nr:Palmitoyltransferase [Mortierella claussenii]
MAVNIAVDGGVLLAVGVLTIYHFWSMISNTSTIEVWEQEKVEAMIKKGKLRKTKFPYDVGCFRNYRQVLGPRFWLWLWPQQMMGSGTEFEVTDDKDAALIWPPREYQTSKKQDRTFISEYTSSSIRQRRNRNLSSLGTPVSPKGVHGVAANDAKHEGRGSGGSKRRTRINSGGSGSSRGSTTAVPAPFPTHVRRGSEGWIVQDLTVQQRAELYDRQQQYQLQHPDHAADNDEEEDEEQEEYHEGLSDIEGHAYGGLPGGMQGSHDDYNDDEYNVAEQDERLERHQQRIMTSSSEDDDDDIPYDVISDEYDDDGYGDDDEEYHGDDDDLDEQNPYLAYADEDDEEEEEEEEEEQEYEEDEVTLHGQDRHKIGRFFDTMDPRSRQQDVDDEWDEGDGVDVGCRPPAVGRVQGMGGMDGASSLEYEPKQKTFYTMLVEREEALKKQQKHK